jgi:hypothetical protein
MSEIMDNFIVSSDTSMMGIQYILDQITSIIDANDPVLGGVLREKVFIENLDGGNEFLIIFFLGN